MRINFAATAFPVRFAKSLTLVIPGVTDLEALAITAEMFGRANWRELSQDIAQFKGTSTDLRALAPLPRDSFVLATNTAPTIPLRYREQLAVLEQHTLSMLEEGESIECLRKIYSLALTNSPAPKRAQRIVPGAVDDSAWTDTPFMLLATDEDSVITALDAPDEELLPCEEDNGDDTWHFVLDSGVLAQLKRYADEEGQYVLRVEQGSQEPAFLDALDAIQSLANFERVVARGGLYKARPSLRANKALTRPEPVAA
jgi:hypothetical protein